MRQMDYNTNDARIALQNLSPDLKGHIELLWAGPGRARDKLVLMARLARYDERVAVIVRTLVRLQLPSGSDRAAVEAVLANTLSQRAPLHPPATLVRPTPSNGARSLAIRIDPEIARICVALRLDPLLRIWAILKHFGARNGGKLTKQAARGLVAQWVSGYTDRHFRRLVGQGDGLFWHVSRQGTIYLIGGEKLSQNVINLAYEQGRGADVVGTNLPGATDVYTPVTGTIEQFRANVYGAWLAYKNDVVISRDRLQALFGRGLDTLLRWERARLQGRLRLQRNIGQAVISGADDYEALAGFIPNNASVKSNHTWKGDVLLTWRMPNSYAVFGFDSANRGKAQKRRRASNNCRATIHSRPGETWIFERRRYFGNAEQLSTFQNRRVKHHKGDLYPGDHPGYVWRGENRRGLGVYELVADWPRTGPNTRARGEVAERFRADQQAKLRIYLHMRTFLRPPIVVHHDFERVLVWMGGEGVGKGVRGKGQGEPRALDRVKIQ